MSEYTEGHRPSAGEQQARAAEKIIQNAQEKTPRANLDAHGAAKFFSVKTQDHHDAAMLAQARNELFGQKKGPIHLITPFGSASTPEEVAKLFAIQRQVSDEHIERSRLEAIAKINATKRLPFGERLWLLMTGMPPTSEKAEEILQEERKKLGL